MSSTTLTISNAKLHMMQLAQHAITTYTSFGQRGKFVTWFTAFILLQRLNRRNLVGLFMYLFLYMSTLPVRHLIKVILDTDSEEAHFGDLTLREDLFLHFLRYSFANLSIYQQRALAAGFCKVTSKLHASPMTRTPLKHDHLKPADQPIYLDWYGTDKNIGAETRVILYSHGGGYSFGHSQQYPAAFKLMLQKLKKDFGMDVRLASLEYRLSPEAAVPGAVLDALAAYDYLVDTMKIPAHHIIISGDSAGGNLSLSLLIQTRESGRPMPAGAMLFSPWVDARKEETPFYDYMFRDYLTRESTDVFSQNYLQNKDANNQVASPGIGDLNNLPPIMVSYGGKELLAAQIRPWLDDVQRDYPKLDLELVSNERMYHIAPLLADLVGPAALDDLLTIIDWMGRKFKSAKPMKYKEKRVEYTPELLKLID